MLSWPAVKGAGTAAAYAESEPNYRRVCIMETTFNAADRKLNVVLHSSTLPASRGDYYGKVQRNATLTMENLINSIKEHEPGVQPLIIQYCAGLLKTEVLRQLALGSAINILDLCTVYLGVKGGMSGENPDADAVESLVVRCTPSPELRAVAKGLSVASVIKAGGGALINDIVDLYTGAENSVITANRALRISGSKLRIAGDAATVGIYFVSAADPETRIKVPAGHLTRNMPKTLEFFVPDALVSGTAYWVELVSQYASGSALLKEPRAVRSPVTLTVS